MSGVRLCWYRFPSCCAAVFTAAACSDPAPPDPAVASIVLSVPDTGTSIRFRDPLIVKATPQAALGVPLVRPVTWTSVTPALLDVQSLSANGDSARIRASGVGTGEIQVTSGAVSRSFQVTVKDTVYSVLVVATGALGLVVGDTVSFTATVEGPPTAEKSVRWDVSDSAILQILPSLDSQILRLQARAAGAAAVRAVAVADTTKAPPFLNVTAQVGKLVFVTQPAMAQREVPLSPMPTVQVQNAAGIPSTQAANDITLSVVPGGCGAAVTGASTVRASNGRASFPGVAVSARCPAVVLSATATPTATSATSQPFGVTARGCDAVVPFSLTDTVTAVVESGDCVVMRSGRQFFAHTYTLTIPTSSPGVGYRLNTASDAFAPRVESYLWQQDPTVFWADSLNAAGTLANSYWLPPGTHRLVVTSASPAGTGAYSQSTTFVHSAAFPATGVPGCVIATTVGVSIPSSLTGGECDRPFVSRPGASPGRHFLLYLRAGMATQITYRPTGSAEDNDAYLEVFDVTNTSGPTSLIGFDDNSGGGVRGTDAQFKVQPAPGGRFILIRAARVGGGGTSFFTLTISP